MVNIEIIDAFDDLQQELYVGLLESESGLLTVENRANLNQQVGISRSAKTLVMIRLTSVKVKKAQNQNQDQDQIGHAFPASFD